MSNLLSKYYLNIVKYFVENIKKLIRKILSDSINISLTSVTNEVEEVMTQATKVTSYFG